MDTWDGIETFLVTESMVLKHTAKLDPTVPSVDKLDFHVRYSVYSNMQIQAPPGKYYDQNTMPLEPVYTVRSLLLSALAVPLYYTALIFSISPIVTVSLFANPLFNALTCVIIFCFAVEVYGSKKIAFILSLLFGVCSFAWSYQTSFWTQPLQALTLITSAFFIYKSLHYSPSFLCHYLISNKSNGIYFAGLGGLFLGLSVFAHPTSIILVPGFIIYSIYHLRKNPRILFSFLVTVTITLFFIGLVNYLRFGSFTEFGYGYFASLQTHNGWRGLIGLLVSPGAGLFLYFPTSILLPLAAIYMNKENRSLFLLFMYIIVATWLSAGTLSFDFEPFSWWGTGWGPRYLLCILPFITIMLGSILSHIGKHTHMGKRIHIEKKTLPLTISFIALSVAGFCISLLGVLIWWQYDIVYVSEKEQLWNQDPWNLIVWNPSYSPIVLHTKMLMTDYLSHIDPQKYVDTGWNWIAYGSTPCSYDLYIFCNFGIAPVLFSLAVIAILGYCIGIQTGMFKISSKRLVFRKLYKSS
ncbi:hypothetical protein [Candidatus Nitrosocosmicus arcticus]|nr:hypothetical protein [Candidatus Nitrosocosmicus arcticus]